MGIKKRPDWYLKKVKPKQNRDWSNKEKTRVFTLRTSKTPVPAREVARKLGVNIIQIYNITRLVRRGVNKECFICGHNLTKEELAKDKNRRIKACGSCKAKAKIYKRGRRKKAIKKKLCCYCEKRKVLPGHQGCERCLSATQRRRYLEGLCGQCGKYPISKNSTTLCVMCLEENKERSTKFRELKKA